MGCWGTLDIFVIDSTTLFGKTAGLIGTGTIGRCFIRICRGFGMKVICYDISQDKRLTEEYGVEFVSENDIFRRSDVISLHCPLTP